MLSSREQDAADFNGTAQGQGQRMPGQVVQKRHWIENGMCGGSNKQRNYLYSRLIDDGEGRFR